MLDKDIFFWLKRSIRINDFFCKLCNSDIFGENIKIGGLENLYYYERQGQNKNPRPVGIADLPYVSYVGNIYRKV